MVHDGGNGRGLQPPASILRIIAPIAEDTKRGPAGLLGKAAALKRAILEEPARRNQLGVACSLERSNFELAAPFFVETQTGEPTGRYKRRKLAGPCGDFWQRVSL